MYCTYTYSVACLICFLCLLWAGFKILLAVYLHQLVLLFYNHSVHIVICVLFGILTLMTNGK